MVGKVGENEGMGFTIVSHAGFHRNNSASSLPDFSYLPFKFQDMEKRILGVVLSILGAIGLIYAGIIFLNGGMEGKQIRAVLFAGILGAIFFFAGIGLVKNTSDKPT